MAQGSYLLIHEWIHMYTIGYIIHYQRDTKSRIAGKERIWKPTNANSKTIYLLDYNLQGSRECAYFTFSFISSAHHNIWPILSPQ